MQLNSTSQDSRAIRPNRMFVGETGSFPNPMDEINQRTVKVQLLSESVHPSESFWTVSLTYISLESDFPETREECYRVVEARTNVDTKVTVERNVRNYRNSAEAIREYMKRAFNL